ncbi:hypothetical protein GCM10012275_63570 [Longimycelium tulufanense]|uniref:Uncharacterized protein n=1 Tax=Longimycelium tulufanense TaxID=907463 RepID=A0A8J3FY14_9PSEU|nr:hypothetical protein GCM10012275_63570 [Longimycelium tulufanense]
MALEPLLDLAKQTAGSPQRNLVVQSASHQPLALSPTDPRLERNRMHGMTSRTESINMPRGWKTNGSR